MGHHSKRCPADLNRNVGQLYKKCPVIIIVSYAYSKLPIRVLTLKH